MGDVEIYLIRGIKNYALYIAPTHSTLSLTPWEDVNTFNVQNAAVHLQGEATLVIARREDAHSHTIVTRTADGDNTVLMHTTDVDEMTAVFRGAGVDLADITVLAMGAVIAHSKHWEEYGSLEDLGLNVASTDEGDIVGLNSWVPKIDGVS